MSRNPRSQLMRQTLAGLLCAVALYLLAWNEVAAGRGSSLWSMLPLAADATSDGAARNWIRAGTALLAVSGSFFCLAGMGNTLGLISLFGGRIALSARLTGAVLGMLLVLAAAALGHYAGDPATATLLVTPLASVLLLLLWQSRRERLPAAVRASTAAAPILLDLPERPGTSAKITPAVATAPAPTTRPPAVFTARAPRSDQGNPELTPLDFPSGNRDRGRIEPGFGTDLGLPPLEFTPRTVTSSAPAAAPTPPRTPPRHTGNDLPPLDFSSPAPVPAMPAVRPKPAPPSPPALTLDTLDFSAAPAPLPSPAPVPAMAPLADELARWSPRSGPATSAAATPGTLQPTPAPSSPTPQLPTPTSSAPPRAAPAPAAAQSGPAKMIPVRAPIDLGDDEPAIVQAFTLDTVAPREQGPRRALLDEEPDLLAQLGSLAQVQTPPSAPLTPLLSESAPEVLQQASTAPPPMEPERIKLADKGVFSIYKLVDGERIVGYALTEHGITVMVGTQEQVKQNLRDRWPGRR